MSDKKVALVTGATRGIGRAIAEQLAARGYCVIGTATTDEGAHKITDYLKPHAGHGMRLNVADKADIDALCERIVEQYGTPFALVNNAAVTRDNLALRMKDEEWDTVIQTNLTSVFYLTKLCLRGMLKARAGRIVNITSVVGTTGNAGQTNYAAAKAGIIGYTKSLAQEVATRSVTVNAVAPGFIDTDMTRGLSEEQKQMILAVVPMGRLGQPSDIANTVCFLISDEAQYITGQTWHVNGGMYMAG